MGGSVHGDDFHQKGQYGAFHGS